MQKRYSGQTAAFLTQHGKEALVAPILEPFLGCEIRHIDGYDTDQLGTFSGEVKRLDNQIETARKKARIGAELSGLTFAIASEGAFIPDPLGGLIPWNIEVVLWMDTKSEFEVIGIAQGPTLSLHKEIRTLSDLEIFAKNADFPAHHLVVRPQSESDLRIHKGISDWNRLREAFIACQHQSTNGCVYVEHDHRSFCHPTRQAMIQRAVHDLVEKFQSICPHCTSPGFSKTGHRSGLKCQLCGNKTNMPVSFTMLCSSCGHTEEKLSAEVSADPRWCDVCNP